MSRGLKSWEVGPLLYFATLLQIPSHSANLYPDERDVNLHGIPTLFLSLKRTGT